MIAWLIFDELQSIFWHLVNACPLSIMTQPPAFLKRITLVSLLAGEIDQGRQRYDMNPCITSRGS